MTGRESLQAEIAAAMRRVELAEARVAGLIRAQLSATSVLWYSRDAARQLVFEEAFDEGRRLLTAAPVVAGSTENRPPVSESGACGDSSRRFGNSSV